MQVVVLTCAFLKLKWACVAVDHPERRQRRSDDPREVMRLQPPHGVTLRVISCRREWFAIFITQLTMQVSGINNERLVLIGFKIWRSDRRRLFGVKKMELFPFFLQEQRASALHCRIFEPPQTAFVFSRVPP